MKRMYPTVAIKMIEVYQKYINQELYLAVAIDFVAAISKPSDEKEERETVDKCQGNGRGFAKTLIEKRFPSTVRKSNITRATSDSFPPFSSMIIL